MNGLATVVAIPLDRAVLCLDCSTITTFGPNYCPSCGSAPLVPVSTWLNRTRAE